MERKRSMWKRLLSLTLALAMVLAMVPAPTANAATTAAKTLYLKPNDNWKSDGARFAAYFFGNGEKWVSMTDSNNDGIYEVAVPTSHSYPNVIFCRMNGSTSANNWNNKWNQTADLKVPTDGKNLFTIPNGSWDGATTSWSVHTFKISANLTNLTANISANAPGGYSYSTTFSATEGYTLPESINVTMGGKTLTAGTGYTYIPSSGVLTIPNVNGDLVITAAGVETPVGGEQPDSTILYFVPGDQWGSDNARYAAYFFVDNSTFTWANVVDSNNDGYYEVAIPDGGYTTVIFCRMNGGTAGNSWENKWNQTKDLPIPTDGSNCFTINSNTQWENSGASGVWSTYSPAGGGEGGGETPQPPVPEATYIIAGNSTAVFGTSWDPSNASNKMALNAATGLYEKTYASVPVGAIQFKVTDGSWDHAWPNENYNYAVDAISNVTITFNANTKEITVTAEPTGEVAEPVNNVTIHFRNTGLWGAVHYHVWREGNPDVDLTSWPGNSANFNSNETVENWFTVTLSDLNAPNGIGIIFNNGNNGEQTSDISITKDGEYWYDAFNGGLLTAAPENSWPNGGVQHVKYAVKLHFANLKNWGGVNLYTWNAAGLPTGPWPGSRRLPWNLSWTESS